MQTSDAFAIYQHANARLDALIAPEQPNDKSPGALRERAETRLRDLAAFMASLGDPHLSVPVVHVTGTSGKGSTATAIAAILTASGRKTLLHTSPYLQVATEKLQVDGRLISSHTFAELTDQVIAAAESFPGRITYGEAWFALVALAMRDLQPDVAVIEVGAGGRFDLTNIVQPSVTVITSVGIDHIETLGGTLAEIAWHKAGIIKAGVPVIHAVTEPEARSVIEAEINLVAPGAINVVDPRAVNPEASSDGWRWSDPITGQSLQSGIPGSIQTLNGAIAVAAARAFDPTIEIEALRTGLANARIAARFEQVDAGPITILDGAHNPQKIAALLSDLERLPRPRIGIIGFLAAKRAEEMLDAVLPLLDAAIVCEPHVLGKPGLPSEEGVALIQNRTTIPVSGTDQMETAVRDARERAGSAGSVIVTGSLYLCGQAREQWYPSAEIIRRQTQWPEIPPRP